MQNSPTYAGTRCTNIKKMFSAFSYSQSLQFECFIGKNTFRLDYFILNVYLVDKSSALLFPPEPSFTQLLLWLLPLASLAAFLPHMEWDEILFEGSYFFLSEFVCADAFKEV